MPSNILARMTLAPKEGGSSLWHPGSHLGTADLLKGGLVWAPRQRPAQQEFPGGGGGCPLAAQGPWWMGGERTRQVCAPVPSLHLPRVRVGRQGASLLLLWRRTHGRQAFRGRFARNPEGCLRWKFTPSGQIHPQMRLHPKENLRDREAF